MKRPFRLVPSRGSRDTKKCIRILHEGAESDHVIGVAYAVFYNQRDYEVHVCGEAHRSPTFARGAVQVLDDKLGRLIHGTEQ